MTSTLFSLYLAVCLPSTLHGHPAPPTCHLAEDKIQASSMSECLASAPLRFKFIVDGGRTTHVFDETNVTAVGCAPAGQGRGEFDGDE
jgi:hypothetical protein